MRKLLLTILCLILLCGCVYAQSPQVSELNTQIQVDLNGVRHVTATAVIDFKDQTTSFVFPLGKDADDITVTGGSYEIHIIDGVKCVVFTNELGYIGKQSFLCTYTLPCTMTEGLDSQGFRMKVPERGWEYAIDKFSLTVNFPVDISEFPVWESSYYGDEIDNYLRIQIKDNQVCAESNQAFRDHETITMALTFPKNSFTLRHLAEQTVATNQVIFFLLVVLCLGYWFLRLRGKVFFRNKESTITFLSSAGEIPCQISNSLPDMGGLIAHWGNLGYISLVRTKRGTFRLEKRMEMGNERSNAERRLFQSIFRTLSSVDMSGLRFRSAVASDAPILRAYWKSRMFRRDMGKPRVLRFFGLLAGVCVSMIIFDTTLPAIPSRWFRLVFQTLLTVPLYWLVQKAIRSWHSVGRWFFLGLGLISAVILFRAAGKADLGGFMFLNLALQGFCAFVTRFGGKHTAAGEETVDDLMGFGRYISHINADSARSILRKDPQYFYRALPYAEILGRDRRFVRYFGKACAETCPWMRDERNPDLHATEFYSLYKELLVYLRVNALLQTLRSKFGRQPHVPRVSSANKSSSSRNTRSSSSHRPTAGTGPRDTHRS
ncbi:MAG: DUF2207 domain-containing protein [Oscillospiraceae bacterium]|nr:DUF2207 domain-containing protein [Oscillospiraceae bacterium]